MLKSSKLRGFNLIELMVALAAGLVIIGAVTTFVASTISNSSATVQSTRLTQELRVLTEVVAREVRRARAVQDPIGKIGSGCSTSSTCAMPTITVSAGCVLYAYEGATGGNFRVIRRAESSGVGSLVLAAGGTAQTCSTTGTTINSNLVDVTDFAVAVNSTNPSQIDITVQGRLRGDASGVTQTYRTSVFVRSGSA